MSYESVKWNTVRGEEPSVLLMTQTITIKCPRTHATTKIGHKSFTPLVFSASGGMGHEASVFYKRLASLLSDK